MAGGNLQYQFARLNFAEKLIAVNVLIFLLVNLLPVLFGISSEQIISWFELPEAIVPFISQPWSIVTYSFFHAGFGHIFWNMLLLYFFGRIFFNLFDSQKFIAVYFLGVIIGGALFIMAYNVFPTLSDTNAILIGASAGVTAVLIFTCTYIPNQEIRIIFFNVKLWQLGAFVILKDVVTLASGENVGGMFAHLGGALLGYVYARQLFKGRDIGEGFINFLNNIGDLFKPSQKKAPLKTVYKKNTTKRTGSKVDYDKETRQRKIDAILDKISKSGYESLSQAEKDFLFKAGKED
ncbi:rhomboid family intramembrane serine protease [Croceitalea rosinachiae]|uniref:Rhomboid family intramembrane serine protease n=1 Tax=Croceitalea rosinachiae TaxID=3075596 RepID=A0ABU3A9Y3_9FLAO|nr:rhomboid family intramembrane serine protease [Croceitalea sp. F388]MDT0607000.1 rhomboid family intramembrane serine protease [Croceitalea sp. F388]